MKVELERITDKPEIAIAKSASISYDSEVNNLEKARKLNKSLIDRGHHSPLEFASATFYIEGVSRVTLSQLTRHRIASFMVQSFRYTEPDNGVHVPESVEGWINKTTANQDALEQAKSNVDWLYDQMVEDGVPKEDARMYKFMGEKTKIYLKTNFREFRHIIKLRGLNEHAQNEIRYLSQEILEYLYYEAPSIFEDLMEEYEENFRKEGE